MRWFPFLGVFWHLEMIISGSWNAFGEVVFTSGIEKCSVPSSIVFNNLISLVFFPSFLNILVFDMNAVSHLTSVSTLSIIFPS